MQMITWVILPVLCVIAVAVYLYRKVKAAVKCFLPAYSLKRQRIFAGIISLLLIIPAVRIYGMWFIILLHFTVFLLLLDAVVFLIKKLKKQNQLTGLWNKIYRSGVIAILLTAVLIGYGRYNIFHVVRTEYNIQTQKNIREEGYRIVLLSDLHYGVSMNDNNLQDVVNRISAEQADIVVLDGDIVDENTTSEQMQSAFRILGQADSTYGVYYVYGNHDKSRYAINPNYTEEELKEFMKEIGEKPVRGTQIYSWIYKGAKTFDDMKNIPKSLREKLEKVSYIGNLETELVLKSKVDKTKKYLFLLNDGNIIESVMMEYEDRVTACISNQVGCRMGCRFCASTMDGLIRNLEPWEILDQIIKIQEDTGKRVSNLVLMGSGEPLDNFENTKQFLKVVNDKNGLNIGYRHITLSTCGVIPKMYELADLNIPINLALSLHSPFDDKRAEIMPVAKAYKVKDLIKACQNYIDKTNRRVTFEYSLIKGVNDSKAESDEISKLLKGMLCHVNLIPINKVEERDFERPDKTYIYKFRDALEKNNIPTTVRNSMGSDIGGACGQLRRKHK